MTSFATVKAVMVKIGLGTPAQRRGCMLGRMLTLMLIKDKIFTKEAVVSVVGNRGIVQRNLSGWK
jgi:hypothetical protein